MRKVKQRRNFRPSAAVEFICARCHRRHGIYPISKVIHALLLPTLSPVDWWLHIGVESPPHRVTERGLMEHAQWSGMQRLPKYSGHFRYVVEGDETWFEWRCDRCRQPRRMTASELSELVGRTLAVGLMDDGSRESFATGPPIMLG